jgi:hypothetical protein
MKRPTLPKRRQRRSGQSPYARYSKAPYLYSGPCQEWKRANDQRTANVAVRRKTI